MKKCHTMRWALFAVSAVFFLGKYVWGDGRLLVFSEFKPVEVVVPGNVLWTDTGLDVSAGQEISFRAKGRVTLQVGNPQADCGPDGYELKTVQQPLPEQNLGSLIGKVVISVMVGVDEETGEEKRVEASRLFFIGSENKVQLPASGRLFLGINENVIGDNAGEFRVTIVMSDQKNYSLEKRWKFGLPYWGEPFFARNLSMNWVS
ncbi:MAG: hypothetical protein QHH14_11575 [Clostridiales bacterium]|nr:hypothetical protein [Clostridiales bacterium]